MIDPTLGWQTARLSIEPFAADSADELFEVLDDPQLHEFIGGKPLSRPELAARYERLRTGRSPDGAEIWANWLVRELVTGRAIGTLQVTLPAAGPDSGIDAGPAAVAWVIGLRWQEQGFAAEAASSLVDQLAAAGWRVVAHIHPEHVASQGVALRAGLVPTDEMVEGEIRYERR